VTFDSAGWAREARSLPLSGGPTQAGTTVSLVFRATVKPENRVEIPFEVSALC
jgi:hypothetical protein